MLVYHRGAGLARSGRLRTSDLVSKELAGHDRGLPVRMTMTTGVKRARSSFLVFGSPFIGEPEIDEVVATLRSGWIGTGPRVAKFEERMTEYTGAEHAMAVSSCTAALHLSMLALGIGPGDEVVTTPMTFAATAN